MDINYVRPEKQPKDYVPQKSVDDIPVTKALSGKAIRDAGERGSSITNMFSNNEGPQMIGPQNNRGRCVMPEASQVDTIFLMSSKERVANKGA